MRGITNIKSTVLDILSDVLEEDKKSFQENQSLHSYQWDSIVSLDVFLRLEDKFGVEINLQDFHEARTIKDLVTLVS